MNPQTLRRGDNPPLVDADGRIEIIRELCSFEGRLTGTDAERRAANSLAGRLRGSGRKVEVEPIYVHPQVGLVHGAHCALGFAGSLLAIASPPAGFAVVLATAVSMYLDLNARFYLLRRLFFRRASQNVLASGRSPGAPARLYVCAHYDAGRTGSFFRPRTIARFTRLARLFPSPLGPFHPLFWSLAILLPILGARMAGIESNAVSVLQLPPTLVLLIGVFMLVDVELSGVVPGANDNASGVAAALSLADTLDAEPADNLDVWLLLTGGEECLMEGMRSFLRAHRKELDPERVYFLNLDSVGNGDVRYLTGEGLAVTVRMDPRLIELCAAVATADRENGHRYRAEPLSYGLPRDALPIRLAGFPVADLTTLAPGALFPANYHRPEDVPGAIDPEALERAQDFALDLVRQLDREVGRKVA
jgi:hypothetical protein